MVDPKKMSIEEMLAHARKTDGGGADSAGDSDAGDSNSGAEAAAETPANKPVEKAAASGGGLDPADARKMSVEDMLAAARGEKSGDKPAASAPKEAAAEAEPAAASGGGLDPAEARKMSVEEMLAAARGEASGGKTAPKAAAKPKAAKPAAGAAKKKAAPVETKKEGPLDTASILAAARGDAAKRGPKSKKEAAAEAAPAGAVAEKPAKVKPTAPPMPEKPAYARAPTPAPASNEESRRGFFASATGFLFGSSLAVGFSTLTLTHLLWGLGLARFMFPNVLIEPPTKFTVGFPGDLSPGQVETKYKAQFGVWIVKGAYEGQNMIYALKSVCTHLGCTPNWLEGEQKFKCPCHGSGFYKDGVNFEGPAPRPLERYAVRIADDGQIEVDKSQTFFEEKGDWKESSSYVPV